MQTKSKTLALIGLIWINQTICMVAPQPMPVQPVMTPAPTMTAPAQPQQMQALPQQQNITPQKQAPAALPTVYIQNVGSTAGTLTQIDLNVKDMKTGKVIPLCQTVNIALPAATKNGPASVVEFNPTVSGAKNQLAFEGLTALTINGSIVKLNPTDSSLSAQTALQVKERANKTWGVKRAPKARTTGSTGPRNKTQAKPMKKNTHQKRAVRAKRKTPNLDRQKALAAKEEAAKKAKATQQTKDTHVKK